MKPLRLSIAPLVSFVLLAPVLAQQTPMAAAAPEEDIRGAKPLVPIPPPPPPTPWLTYGLIALGIVLAIGVLVWFLKRRPAPLPAEKLARLDLERLAREGDRLPATEFASAASAIVRLFIERRFGLAAPKRTTEEFLKELAAKPEQGLHTHLEALRGFLKACDKAKFAAAGLEAEQRQELVGSAREVIAAPVVAPALPPPTPS